jgi:hypothetical protein
VKITGFMIQNAPGAFLNSSRNNEYSEGKLNVAGKKSYLILINEEIKNRITNKIK